MWNGGRVFRQSCLPTLQEKLQKRLYSSRVNRESTYPPKQSQGCLDARLIISTAPNPSWQPKCNQKNALGGQNSRFRDIATRHRRPFVVVLISLDMPACLHSERPAVPYVIPPGGWLVSRLTSLLAWGSTLCSAGVLWMSASSVAWAGYIVLMRDPEGCAIIIIGIIPW